MVTKMSAERIGHHVRNIEHLSSDTDHRGLVRFEHSLDGRYVSMVEKLKEMASEAPRALQTRARSGYFGGEVQACTTNMTSPPPLSSAKPAFWRIQNIKTSERDAAKEWLLSQTKELEITEGQGFSLAADGERTLCATLTSYERPKPSNCSWRVDMDFIGFTPLSDPDDANVDIVAVTGLGGHALRSFRSADGLLYGCETLRRRTSHEHGSSRTATILLSLLATATRAFASLRTRCWMN
jgi:hypothetical protein